MNPEYLAAAMQAGGDLDGLGWFDLLPHLDDPDARDAVFALFRAQGATLGSTVALGALLAHPHDAIAAVPGPSGLFVLGDPGDRPILIDGAYELRPIEQPGRMVLHEVVGGRPATVDASLGRLAIACEILGATEAVVALAVQYASDRQQFGEPIGRFQAVRHLLAWARTDVVAIEHVVREGIDIAFGPNAPERYDEIVKAIAGRNGRRACERALQVFGGIGFTAEHDHHHFHSRVLALDALLGSSAELTHGLGAWLRTEQRDPQIARYVLRIDTPAVPGAP